MNYTELSQQIHAAQVAKGFYDEKKSDPQIISLIISELYEMMDCHRKGKFVNIEILERFLNLKKWGDYDIELFEKHLKTTFEFEFVDVFIRLLDYAGYKKLQIAWYGPYNGLKSDLFADILEMNLNFIELLNEWAIIERPISMLELFAELYKIDFERLIPIKLAYNATLPYKHGKRY